jgi:hypothetical protein
MTHQAAIPANSSRRAAALGSPFVRGAVLIAIYLLVDSLGLRKYAGIMSGTLPYPGCSFFEAKCIATLYLSSYLLAHLLAPVYFISGVFEFLITKFVTQK